MELISRKISLPQFVVETELFPSICLKQSKKSAIVNITNKKTKETIIPHAKFATLQNISQMVGAIAALPC